MSDALRKIAYARGMLQGQKDGDQQGVQAVLASVLDALESVGEAVEEMRHDLDELSSYVQAVDDDLFDVETDLYGYDEGYDEAEMTELECPQCHTPLVVEAEFLEDDAAEVTCPECGHVLHRGPVYEASQEAVATGSENGQHR